MHGLTLAGVLVEEGVSGSVPVEDRPVGGPLLARLERGDIVIAAKLDRLFRSALDALKVVESLKTRGLKLHLVDLGGDIAGNGLAKLFLTIATAFAEAERDRVRERIGQVKADQKARGRYLGEPRGRGRRPKGVGRLTGEDGELVPHFKPNKAIHGNVSLRAQDKALRLICGGGLRRASAPLPMGAGNHVALQGFGLALFTAVCLLGETAGWAHAQCNIVLCASEWSHGRVINLGGLTGSAENWAVSINDAGQAVGYSIVDGLPIATAKSSTWEACRAPFIAKPKASTTAGKWWEPVFFLIAAL
jgi:putative DNA-invertase from lambdoid prophage Rac